MTNQNANLNLMVKAAYNAGDQLLRDFEEIIRLQSSIQGTEKLTQKALARAEYIIKDELITARPNYTLRSGFFESFEGKDPTRSWLVQTISGLDNFRRGIPNWVVSIGLIYKDEIQVAVIYQPNDNEIYKCVRGNGAYSSRFKLRVTPTRQTANSIIAIDVDSCRPLNNPFPLKNFFSTFQTIRSSGSACLDIINLSAGKIDGFIGFENNALETGPAQLILSEAGGLTSELKIKANNTFQRGLLAAGHHNFDEFKAAVIELINQELEI